MIFSWVRPWYEYVLNLSELMFDNQKKKKKERRKKRRKWLAEKVIVDQDVLAP